MFSHFFMTPQQIHPTLHPSSKTPRRQRLRLRSPPRAQQRRGRELAPVAAGGGRVVALNGAHQFLEAIFEEGHGSNEFVDI